MKDDYLQIEAPDLPDYKFFCFSVKVKMLYIATERQKKGGSTKFDFFDANFNHLPFRQSGHPNAQITPSMPRHFERMKTLAEQLSKGIPHVRIDFYENGDDIYFGEMTFFSMSGLYPYQPEKCDYKIGEWLMLPEAFNIE